MGHTRYTAGSYTEAGRTEKNQDCHVLFDLTLPEGSSGPRRTVKVAITADGINGHQGGEIASKKAVDTIKEAFTKLDTPMLNRMQSAIQQANRAIYEQALKDPKVRGMGCTVVMAVLDEEKLYVANVGDSRAYLIRNGIAHQLTEDHVRIDGLPSSTPELTRRLGRTSKVNVDLGCIPLSNSHNQSTERIGSISLQRGDTIVLCTDGLTGELVDDYIQQIVSSTSLVQTAAQRLVAKARAAGATDDITALVIRWPDHTRRNLWLLVVLLLLGLLWFNWDKISINWIAPLQTQLYQYVISNKQYPGFSALAPILESQPSPTVTFTSMPTVTPAHTDSPTPTNTPPATNTLAPTFTAIPPTATPQPTFTATTVDTITPTQAPTPTFTREAIVAPTVKPTSTFTPIATPTLEQTPTARSTQTATATATPSLTGTPAALSPADCSNIPNADKLQVSLLSPANDSAGSGVQTFLWSGPELSQQGNGIICAYELFFYQKGQNWHQGFGWAGATFTPSARFRMDAGLTPAPALNTTYLWGVRLVVPGKNYQILALLSVGQERTFRYELQGNRGVEGGSSNPCGGGSLNPCPTSTPQ